METLVEIGILSSITFKEFTSTKRTKVWSIEYWSFVIFYINTLDFISFYFKGHLCDLLYKLAMGFQNTIFNILVSEYTFNLVLRYRF